MRFEAGDLIVQEGMDEDSGLVIKVTKKKYHIFWFHPTITTYLVSSHTILGFLSCYILITDIFRGEI